MFPSSFINIPSIAPSVVKALLQAAYKYKMLNRGSGTTKRNIVDVDNLSSSLLNHHTIAMQVMITDILPSSSSDISLSTVISDPRKSS